MPELSRRGLLVGGAIALGVGLAGCSSTNLPALSLPDPDDEYRLSTAASEQELIGLYSAVIAAFPGLARKLNPIRQQHADHLRAALGDVDFSGGATAPPKVTANRSAALRQLVRAERSAAKERTNASVAAKDGELARLIAQIGASESSHKVLLVRITK